MLRLYRHADLPHQALKHHTLTAHSFSGDASIGQAESQKRGRATGSAELARWADADLRIPEHSAGPGRSVKFNLCVGTPSTYMDDVTYIKLDVCCSAAQQAVS